MSRSAMPATQNDIRTAFETFDHERFCSSPHRHIDATGKPENRDETCWSLKTSISCKTSSNFHTFDVSCEASLTCHQVSQNARPATEFARCHHLTQPWQRDSQKTRHDTPEVLRLPREMTMEVSKVLAPAPATKNGSHLLKTTRKYCACHTE